MIRDILYFGGESARVFFERDANRSRSLCLTISDPSLHQTRALHGEKHPRSCISEMRVEIPSCMSACHNHEKGGTMPLLLRARTTPSVLRNIAVGLECTGSGRKRKSVVVLKWGRAQIRIKGSRGVLGQGGLHGFAVSC